MIDQPHVPCFLEEDLQPAAADAARFHILPVPYERTVSYGGGTAAGPSAILRASVQLEAYQAGAVPGRAGMYTAPMIEVDGNPDEVLGRIAAAVTHALDCGAAPVILGGEHTVTLGALHALLARGEPFGVVQFDAHADLRASYNDTAFSHACVMRHVVDAGIPLVQIGVRSLCEAEARYRTEHRIRHFDAADLRHGVLPPPLLPAEFPERIYITFDVDALDPSVMPATGTPEPGGLDWYQALELLQNLAGQRTLLGFDVVELAPRPGLHYAEFTAAKLVYCMMGLLQQPRVM